MKAGPAAALPAGRWGVGWEMSVLDRLPRFVDDGPDSGVARRRQWQRRYAHTLVALDAVAAVAAAVLAYLLRFFDTAGAAAYAASSLVAPVLWVAAVALAGGYEARILGLGSEEFQRVFRALRGADRDGRLRVVRAEDRGRPRIHRGRPAAGASCSRSSGTTPRRKRLHRRRRAGPQRLPGDRGRAARSRSPTWPPGCARSATAACRWWGPACPRATAPASSGSASRCWAGWRTWPRRSARPGRTRWRSPPGPASARPGCAGCPGSWRAPRPTWWWRPA